MGSDSRHTPVPAADAAMALLASTAFRWALAVGLTVFVVVTVRLNPETSAEPPAAHLERPAAAPVEVAASASASDYY